MFIHIFRLYNIPPPHPHNSDPFTPLLVDAEFDQAKADIAAIEEGLEGYLRDMKKNTGIYIYCKESIYRTVHIYKLYILLHSVYIQILLFI